MNTRNIGYWTATGLVAVACGMGGLMDLSHAPQLIEGMSHLGYPAYVATILGVWKLLGVAALVAPKFPRLKEWAYAGMLFDLTGAAASHLAVGDPIAKAITPLVILALVAVSWALRPSSRVLGVLPFERARGERGVSSIAI